MKFLNEIYLDFNTCSGSFSFACRDKRLSLYVALRPFLWGELKDSVFVLSFDVCALMNLEMITLLIVTRNNMYVFLLFNV